MHHMIPQRLELEPPPLLAPVAVPTGRSSGTEGGAVPLVSETVPAELLLEFMLAGCSACSGSFAGEDSELLPVDDEIILLLWTSVPVGVPAPEGVLEFALVDG